MTIKDQLIALRKSVDKQIAEIKAELKGEQCHE